MEGFKILVSNLSRRHGSREGGWSVAMAGTTKLYHYFRKFDGNVCMDWRLTSDLNTSLQTTDGKTKLVHDKILRTIANMRKVSS